MSKIVIDGQELVVLEKKSEMIYTVRKARGKKTGFLLLDKMRYVIGTQCVDFDKSEFKIVA